MTQVPKEELADERVIRRSDGVVVRIGRRETDDGIPAFSYDVGSEREDPVEFELRQPLPESISTEEIGYPRGCEEDWRLEDDTLVLERAVEPDEPFQTVWGVSQDEHPDIEPPWLSVASSGESGGATAGGSDGDGTDDADGIDDADGTDDADGAADADASDGDLEGGRSGDADGDAPGESDDAEGPDIPDVPETAAAADDLLVARLASALASDDLPEEHRQALQDAIEVRASDSTNAFVEHLQSKLEQRAEQLAEEVAALEQSVERLSSAKADSRDLVEIKRGLTDLDEAKASYGELQSLAEDVEALEADVEAATGTLSELRSDQASLRSDHEELAEQAARSEQLQEVREQLSEVSAESSSTAQELSSLQAAHQMLSDRALTEDDVSDLREDLAEVRGGAVSSTEADGDRIESLASRIESLENAHQGVAQGAASSNDVEEVRAELGGELDELQSDVAVLQSTVEEEYVSEAEVQERLESQVHRAFASVGFLAVGVGGLVATAWLALQSSTMAGVTFLVGGIALALWWRLLRSERGTDIEDVSSPGDLL